MKNTFKLFTVVLLIAALLCGCSSTKGNTGPAVELTEEEKALQEAIAADINVIAPDDFSATVSGLTKETSGQIYQLTGYFQSAAEDEENPSLANAPSNPKTVIEMRYLTKELTVGDRYTITGVVTVEEHDGHAHITFDALTVETYTGK